MPRSAVGPQQHRTRRHYQRQREAESSDDLDHWRVSGRAARSAAYVERRSDIGGLAVCRATAIPATGNYVGKTQMNTDPRVATSNRIQTAYSDAGGVGICVHRR